MKEECFHFVLDHSSPKAFYDSLNESERRYKEWCDNMKKLSKKQLGEMYTVCIDGNGIKKKLTHD